jgi:hypothetical protein
MLGLYVGHRVALVGLMLGLYVGHRVASFGSMLGLYVGHRATRAARCWSCIWDIGGIARAGPGPVCGTSGGIVRANAGPVRGTLGVRNLANPIAPVGFGSLTGSQPE